MPTRARRRERGWSFLAPGSSTRRATLIVAGVLAASLIPLASTDPPSTSGTQATVRSVGLPTRSPAATGSVGGAPGSPLPELLAPALAQVAATIEADGSVQVGVAVITVASPTTQPATAGSLISAPGWSTMKVPLALAVQHRRVPTESTRALMVAAITTSDNEAADQLYSSLGDAATASALVQQELARYGDSATEVPRQLRRAGFSIIGQTEWTLAASARFVAALPCSADAAEVWDLMGQISDSQRWGLGRIEGSHFKGGWGPQSDGSYLVRQIAVVPTPSGGMVAVAMAARANDGSFGSGTLALDRLTTALAPMLASATATC